MKIFQTRHLYRSAFDCLLACVSTFFCSLLPAECEANTYSKYLSAYLETLTTTQKRPAHTHNNNKDILVRIGQGNTQETKAKAKAKVKARSCSQPIVSSIPINHASILHFYLYISMFPCLFVSCLSTPWSSESAMPHIYPWTHEKAPSQSSPIPNPVRLPGYPLHHAHGSRGIQACG